MLTFPIVVHAIWVRMMRRTRRAERLKNDGNEYYHKDRLGAAIDAYTEAITLCPNVAVYWTNSALCHRRRKDWERVEDDCRKALQLDHDSVKGHYMLGLALLQKEEYSVGVKELERAMDLGRGAHLRSYIVEEIWQELVRAKYLEWEQNSTKCSWELQNMKGSFEWYGPGHSENLEVLGRVFQKARKPDIPTEVPDYRCCKITLDIFRGPVITPSGLTYERAVLLEHLYKVGRFDPSTRMPLTASQLVPNLAIKAVIQAYL